MSTCSECEQTVFFIVQYPFEPTIKGWLFFAYMDVGNRYRTYRSRAMQEQLPRGVSRSGSFMYRMYGIAQGARDGGARMYRMYGQIYCSCNICTSTIHGGRIAQRACDLHGSRKVE